MRTANTEWQDPERLGQAVGVQPLEQLEFLNELRVWLAGERKSSASCSHMVLAAEVVLVQKVSTLVCFK